jgi:hypothetical protein
VAGLLQRTAAVTCLDQLFDKDQGEACLRSRTCCADGAMSTFESNELRTWINFKTVAMS